MKNSRANFAVLHCWIRYSKWMCSHEIERDILQINYQWLIHKSQGRCTTQCSNTQLGICLSNHKYKYKYKIPYVQFGMPMTTISGNYFIFQYCIAISVFFNFQSKTCVFQSFEFCLTFCSLRFWSMHIMKLQTFPAMQKETTFKQKLHRTSYTHTHTHCICMFDFNNNGWLVVNGDWNWNWINFITMAK